MLTDFLHLTSLQLNIEIQEQILLDMSMHVYRFTFYRVRHTISLELAVIANQ